MPLNLSAAAKTASTDGLRSHFEDGSLEILDSTDTVLVSFGLTATAGTVANGVWTLAYDQVTENAVAGGTASKARLKTQGGVVDIDGLIVDISGADIILDNTNIASGQSVTLTAATITYD